MAQKADFSPCSGVSLKPKPFPSEFENVYCGRCQSSKQNTPAEKVLVAGADRRQRITVADRRGYPSIGLLRIEFNGSTYFTGTASIINEQEKSVLTCGHNVVEYDVITKKFIYPTAVWFELRENRKAGSGSRMLTRYKVTKVIVHPRYFDNPESDSGFDLAVCWIDVPEDDHNIKNLKSGVKYSHERTFLVVREWPRSLSSLSVVGFPGEYEGEKWGMSADVPKDKKSQPDSLELKRRGILMYDFIDTSPGQSGSPIMNGYGSDLVGVHTGGSAVMKKNWGTFIDSDKLKWIAESLGGRWGVGEYDDVEVLYDYTGCPEGYYYSYNSP